MCPPSPSPHRQIFSIVYGAEPISVCMVSQYIKSENRTEQQSRTRIRFRCGSALCHLSKKYKIEFSELSILVVVVAGVRFASRAPACPTSRTRASECHWRYACVCVLCCVQGRSSLSHIHEGIRRVSIRRCIDRVPVVALQLLGSFMRIGSVHC